jgi:Coenzyme PQQ synthesis protein D (PqqD)
MSQTRCLARFNFRGRAMADDDAMLRLRDDGLNWREIDGEVVVLDVERSHYLNLNPTGCVLWLMLAKGTDKLQLVDKLIEEFDVDEPTARADVDAFVTSCRENGLLADPGTGEPATS